MKLDNKIAVITGGNSGIGLSIAELFLQEGAKVVIVGRNKERLQQAQNKLGKHCLAIPADVTQLSDLDSLYHQAKQHFKRGFDVIVANAGIVKTTAIQQTSEKDFDDIFAVNVKGAFFTAQKAINYLNPGASIIFMSSLASKLGMENFSAYCASKAALISMAKTFAAELVAKNIRVNSISPGVIKTPIFDSMGFTDQDIDEWSKQIPMKRAGFPHEIAKAALYLASDDSSYITAADFAVDGGVSGISLF